MSVIATGPAPGSQTETIATADAARRTTRHRFRLAAVFSDAMVLQRDRPIVVFGTGMPGTPISVALAPAPATTSEKPVDRSGKTRPPSAPSNVHDPDDHAVNAATTIDVQGDWSVRLPALPAGGPYTLTVCDGEESIICHDVLIGEVWLAGGQSNMELELRNSLHPADVIAASQDSMLRYYNTPKTGEVDIPAEDASHWSVAGPDTIGVMSAVAYYFAVALRTELGPDVPVGIVDCYVGGTSVTCWMSEERLRSTPAGRGYLSRYRTQIAGKTDAQCRAEYAAWQRESDRWNGAIADARAANPDVTWDELNERFGACPWPPPMTPFSQFRPTGPFEAMLRRVAPYTIRGFLWYQGEEDEARCNDYRQLLGQMIDEWRELWTTEASQSTDAAPAPLPFLVVQLPRWIDKTVDRAGTDLRHWAVIREAQQDAADTIANVHLTVTFDCGEYDNIHPLDKRTVGERLAAGALRHVYGRANVSAEGPRYAQTVSDDGDAADNTRPNAAAAAEHRPALTLRFVHAEGLRFGHWNGDALGENVATPLGVPTGDPYHRSAAESGFELMDANGDWFPADAAIDGDTVTLTADAVACPSVARYGWFGWGPAPLFNGVALPAAPFRTRPYGVACDPSTSVTD